MCVHQRRLFSLFGGSSLSSDPESQQLHVQEDRDEERRAGFDQKNSTTELSESMNSLLELLFRVGVSLSLLLRRPEQRAPPSPSGEPHWSTVVSSF